ncbi:hypothetical protein ACHAWF_018099 [Thalassiosira exigua]
MSSLQQARWLFERGCLLQSQSLLDETRPDKSGRECDVSILYKLIQDVREAAIHTPESAMKLSEGALTTETSKMTVSKMQRQSRGQESGSDKLLDENLESFLFGEDGVVAQSFISTHRSRTPLYVESANHLTSIKRDMMQPLFFGNDRQSGWKAIRDGLRRCPFVTLWHGKIELNDITCRPPKLVCMARLLFHPISKTDDINRAETMLIALNSAVDDTAHDDFGEADKPTMRWWAAFLLVDAEKWVEAEDMIHAVLRDCTTNGVWPGYYLPEALFLASVVQFGLGIKDVCGDYLAAYFDVAQANDRNRADAMLLRLWANDEFPPTPPTLQFLCFKSLKDKSKGCQKGEQECIPSGWNGPERIIYDEIPRLRELLSDLWDEHTFAPYTWLRVQVSKNLGIDEENPFLAIREHVEKQWEPLVNRGMERPKHANDVIEQLGYSCGRTITTRYWEAKIKSDPWD